MTAEQIFSDPQEQEKVWQFGLKEQGELTYEKQKGITYSIGEISNDVTKATLLTNACDVFRKLIEMREAPQSIEGMAKPSTRVNEMYIGLVPDENGVIEMNYEIETKINQEFNSCILSDENIRKYLSDYCKVGRMRQELTIDYAKKKTDLSGITNLLTRSINALGINECNISYGKNGIVIELPKYKTKRINFEDNLYLAKVKILNYVQRLVENNKGIINFIESQEKCEVIEDVIEAIKSKPEQKEFYNIKTIYKDMIGSMINDGIDDQNLYMDDSFEDVMDSVDDYKDTMERLSNMLRMVTPNVSPEARGAYMKACSRRGDSSDENKFYLQICKPEYLLWLISKELNTIEYIGEELYDDDKIYKEGDLIEFENGQDVAGHAYIERPYTGKLVVFKHTNNKLYTGKKLRDAITVPEVNGKIIVKVSQNYITGNIKKIFEQINDRQHNRCLITIEMNKDKKNEPFMKIRSIDGTIKKIPLYIPREYWNLLHGKTCLIKTAELKTVQINIPDVDTGMALMKTIYLKLDIIK